VTDKHARAIYGVVLDADGGVDGDATTARRAEIRRERIGREPERELRAPDDVGVSVVRDGDNGWACASCRESLGGADGNWREAAVLVERPIPERYAELDMKVRDRSEEPLVMLREHFCPSCAASLGVDVATDGLETLPAPQTQAHAVAGAS
jgi:N-methylhydantoinase B